MPVKSRSADGILTIYITDTRLLEEGQITKVAEEVMDLINKTNEENIVLDFQRVEFMSSSMLGRLVQIHKKCKEFKTNLRLSSIQSEIQKVFKITKLDKLFDIQKDEEAARASFSKRKWF